VLVEDWYAARTFGPIVAVNRAGAIKESLTMSAGRVMGKYAVFERGRVDVRFNRENAAAATMTVSPAESLIVNQVVAVPPASGMVALLLYNAAGMLVDTLDRYVYGSIGVERRVAVVSGRTAPAGRTTGTWDLQGRRVGRGFSAGTVVVQARIGRSQSFVSMVR
jgi:YD repeat-containing protein